MACLSAAPPARAQGVYFTPEHVLREFFRGSERVDYVRVDLRKHRDVWRETWGAPPPRDAYVVYVARTGARIDGYAVIDEEVGQHLPITLAVQINPEGRVVRSEVMVYREAYGGEVREQRFLRQFAGKSAGDGLRVDDDIAAISGATLSSRAVSAVVRRAVALVVWVRAQPAGVPTPEK